MYSHSQGMNTYILLLRRLLNCRAILLIVNPNSRLRTKYHDVNSYWYKFDTRVGAEINKLGNNKRPVPLIVGGLHYDTEIAGMFVKKYMALFSSVKIDPAVMASFLGGILNDIHNEGTNEAPIAAEDVTPLFQLLAICAGNSPVTAGFHPHKGQWRGALMFSLICASIKGSVIMVRREIETPSRPLWRHCNVLSSSLCNIIDQRVPVDSIHWCKIIKRVAFTWQNDRVSSYYSSNDQQDNICAKYYRIIRQ